MLKEVVSKRKKTTWSPTMLENFKPVFSLPFSGLNSLSPSSRHSWKRPVLCPYFNLVSGWDFDKILPWFSWLRHSFENQAYEGDTTSSSGPLSILSIIVFYWATSWPWCLSQDASIRVSIHLYGILDFCFVLLYNRSPVESLRNDYTHWPHHLLPHKHGWPLRAEYTGNKLVGDPRWEASSTRGSFWVPSSTSSIW